MTTALALLEARPADLQVDLRIDVRDRLDHKRARAFRGRLRLGVLAMVLLNGVVWGGVVATTRGLIDVHQLADQLWTWGSAWAAVFNGTLDPASW